ncbi:MAG TPA: stalk domain-containing protein [Syntrophomonas sp.]|nr:stalk domain-containing protein [Syntrophomonas sp.]
MIKERAKGFVSGMLAMVLLMGLIGTAAATVGQRTVNLDYTGINITLNGKPITPTDANGNVVEPFAISGTTYLPVRGIANALGLGVSWDAATQTVILTSGAPVSTPSMPSTPTGTYSRTNPAPVGTAQSVTVDSYSGNYTASAIIVDSLRGDAAWNKIKDANMFNSAPEAGKEYVLVKIHLSLDSIDGEKSVSFSGYDFTPYSSTNAEYASTFTVAPSPTFSGSLYQGGTLEGYSVYLVDKTDTAPKLVFGAKYDGTGGIWFAMS